MATRIVEIVGIDGAGKSTLVRELALRADGRARKVAAYPAGFHDAAARVGRVLGAGHEAAMRACAVATALLDEASSASGPLDVFDRYLEAARMFFSVHAVAPVSEEILARVRPPDLVLLLDLDVELALSRRLRPSSSSPQEERSYLEACARYLRRAAREKGWPVLDAARPFTEVCADATVHIRRLRDQVDD